MKKTKLILLAVFPMALGLMVGCGEQPTPPTPPVTNTASVSINGTAYTMEKGTATDPVLESFTVTKDVKEDDQLSFTYNSSVIDLNVIVSLEDDNNINDDLTINNDADNAVIRLDVLGENNFIVYCSGREEAEPVYSLVIGGVTTVMNETTTTEGALASYKVEPVNLTGSTVISFKEDDTTIDEDVTKAGDPNNNVDIDEGTHVITIHNDVDDAVVRLDVYLDGYEVYISGRSPDPVGKTYTMMIGEDSYTLTASKTEATYVEYSSSATITKDDQITFFEDGVQIINIGPYGDNNNVTMDEATHIFTVLNTFTPGEGEKSVFLNVYTDEGYSVFANGKPAPIPAHVIHGTADGATWSDIEMTPTEGSETQYEKTDLELTANYVFAIQMETGDWYHFDDVKSGTEYVENDGSADSNIKIKADGTYDIYCDSLATNRGIYIVKHEAPVVEAYTMKINGGNPIELVKDDTDLPTGVVHQYKATTTVSADDVMTVFNDGTEVTNISAEVNMKNNVKNDTGIKFITPGSSTVYVKLMESGDYVVWATGRDTTLIMTVTASTQDWAFGDETVPVFIWIWKDSDPGTWVKATYVPGAKTVQFTAVMGCNKFLVVRCKVGTVTPDWNAKGESDGRIYNKTGDIDLSGNEYDVTFSSYDPQ